MGITSNASPAGSTYWCPALVVRVSTICCNLATSAAGGERAGGWEDLRNLGSKFRQTSLALLELHHQPGTNLVVCGETFLGPLDKFRIRSTGHPLRASCNICFSVPSFSPKAAMAASSLHALDFAASATTRCSNVVAGVTCLTAHLVVGAANVPEPVL